MFSSAWPAVILVVVAMFACWLIWKKAPKPREMTKRGVPRIERDALTPVEQTDRIKRMKTVSDEMHAIEDKDRQDYANERLAKAKALKHREWAGEPSGEDPK